jgi:Na+/citrate or Na+/malate symporter
MTSKTKNLFFDWRHISIGILSTVCVSLCVTIFQDYQKLPIEIVAVKTEIIQTKEEIKKHEQDNEIKFNKVFETLEKTNENLNKVLGKLETIK